MSSLAWLAYDWAVRCFGKKHVDNPKVRAIRIVEESIELAQALGVPKEQISIAMDHVYSCPKGKPEQELGGVLLTSAVLAIGLDLDPNDIFFQELRRVLNKTPEEFAKRNQNKVDIGLKG